jgi:hypothetical protein
MLTIIRVLKTGRKKMYFVTRSPIRFGRSDQLTFPCPLEICPMIRITPL